MKRQELGGGVDVHFKVPKSHVSAIKRIARKSRMSLSQWIRMKIGDDIAEELTRKNGGKIDLQQR